MSLDRRMQFFIEQFFPIIWDRYLIPVELTFPSEPSDFKCREISPALIELCVKAVWVQSKIVFHHWIQYMRTFYNTMVSSPKAFVTYVAYACSVTAYNTSDHYERFVAVCSLLVGFGANFFSGGNGEVIQYIPKILAVYFERNMSAQFNTRGGWKRLDKYLSRQDYLNWHDETQIAAPDETKEQKLARELRFSKKIELAIKSTYSDDYDVNLMHVKDIEDDLDTNKVTMEVMDYFPEATPSSPEEFKRVKKMKYKETDEACGESVAQKKIIKNLAEFVKRSRSALVHDQQTGSDESSTQQLTETTSKSSKGKVATSTKRRRSKKNKEDTPSTSKNFEASIKEHLSLFTFSVPQSEETSIKQTETAATNLQPLVNLDDGVSLFSNLQTSKETNRKTTHEKLEHESTSGLPLLNAATTKRNALKKMQVSISNTPYSFAEANNRGKMNQECSELLSSSKQNSKATRQLTKFDILEKNNSVVENSGQKTCVDLGYGQYSDNQQTKEKKQKNPKKTGSYTFPIHFSKESTEPKSIDLKDLKSDPTNDQPIEDVKEIKSEIVQDNESYRVHQFTAATSETISSIVDPASVSNIPKVPKKQKTYERAKVKSVSNNQQIVKETNEPDNLRKDGSLPNVPKFPEEKLQKTSEKTEILSPTSPTIPKSREFNSKEEVAAEIRSITESLAPKLEEFAVVIGSLLWDLKQDI